MSYKDNDKEWERIQNRDIVETMRYNKADEAIKKLFEILLFRYQIGLETLIKRSKFVFDCISSSYYKYQKINLNHNGS